MEKLTRILDRLDAQTAEVLQKGIDTWLRGADAHAEDIGDALLRAAAEEQSNIGWDNFMKGRLSRLWKEHIASTTNTHTAIQWERQQTAWIWGLVEAAWENRNTKLFGNTPEESTNTQRLRIEPKVEELYKQCLQLPVNNRRAHTILQLQALLAKPIEYLTLWITQAEATLRTHRKAITKGFYGVPITRFFQVQGGGPG
jgi:hypothetical protein